MDMRRRRIAPSLLVLAAAWTVGACAGRSAPDTAAASEAPVLIGEVTREQVEEAVPDWVEAEVAAEPDRAAALALATVPPGATVTVFLGTWCSDSRRELSRFWRSLDETGGSVPFELAYVGVDRAKQEPADRVAPAGIRYVPTFIVARDGREVGRVVEEAPHGIERDLLALLTGEAAGLLTTKDELLAPAPPGR